MRDIDKGRQQDDKEDFLLSLTPPQQRAYKRVKLFLQALGKIEDEIGCSANIELRKIHEYFPIFAKKMGWRGGMYVPGKDGKCSAVGLMFHGPDAAYWMVFPRISYSNAGEKFDGLPEAEKLTEAARDVAKLWLPNWKW